MLCHVSKKNEKFADRNFRTLYLADQLYCKIELLAMRGFLKNQVLRASSSVVLNLAEGSARRTSADKRRLYNYAHSSAKEVKAALMLAHIDDGELIDLADKVCACTYKLMRPSKSRMMRFPRGPAPDPEPLAGFRGWS